MEQRNLLTQALGFIQNWRRRRRWLRILAGMASVVVFVTVYLLILPAITMEREPLQVTAEPQSAAPGETIWAEISAKAEDEWEETVFLLKADGSNAGLEESGIGFDEQDTAVITNQDGQSIELHREYGEDGRADYWFSLARGQAVSFSLPWINGADRYHTEVTEEQIPVVKETQPEEENLEEPAEDAGEENLEEFPEGFEEENPEEPLEGLEEENPEESPESLGEENSQETGEIIEYETVYHREILLDQEGDISAEGTLKLSFGSGASLEEARNCGDGTLELFWAEQTEETPVPPDDSPENTNHKETDSDTAELTEESSGKDNSVVEDSEKTIFTVSPVNSAKVPMFSASMEAAGLADTGDPAENGGSYDFTKNITDVTVSKLENGQWVPGIEFTNGDSVRIKINYTIPVDTVGTANKTIHYQLPAGICLPRAETGTVYDGSAPVGKYTIDTNGMITITFNEDFADDKAFNGMIQFEGTLSVEESGDEQEIDFGGDGGTITVKPNTSLTDILVEKEGAYDKESGKLRYTVTVSTTKGTEDTVTISDNFQSGNTWAAYDTESFKIIKVSADGSETTMSGFTPEITTGGWEGAPQKFTISNLPKLEAGEEYIVTYTAKPGDSSQANGASDIANYATGTSGGDSSSGWCQVTISKEMIQKWHSYNSNTGKISWTITVNQDERDISGYVLKDTMVIDGQEVSIPSGTVITMTDSDGVSQTITLPHIFPQGSDKVYTITYETDAPTEGTPGEDWYVSNTAKLEGGDKTYTGTGDVTGKYQDYGVGKSSKGLEQSGTTDKLGIYKWVSQITVPEKEVNLDNLTYTDTLTEVSVSGEPVENSHYITASLLDKLTVTVNSTALVRGTDYQICDAKGNVITDFGSQTPLNGFQVKFLDAAKDKVVGQTIKLEYQTLVDYTQLTDSGKYTIANKGSIPDHESTAETEWTKEEKLEKQASITGEGGFSYTDDPIRIDYTSSGGIIHYRVLIRTDEDTIGNITLTDLLPRGAKLVEKSVTMRFYYSDWYEDDVLWIGSDQYKASENISYEIQKNDPDGTTSVIFTIKDGYNGNGAHNTLAVYYELSIVDDPLWTENPALESQLYRNEVSWGSETAGTDVTVEREVPDIQKSGQQLPQYGADGTPLTDSEGNPILSNTIQYGIVINAGEKDFVPGKDYITLWDKLDVGTAAGAEFLPGSVKLYYYDPAQENNCGGEIDSSQYTYIYDETEYKLTFTLPDQTACVLVYEYVIDRGNAAGDLNIKNEAHLTGGENSGGGSEVSLVDTSSSASVTKRVLTIYKVDATNFGKLLPGAKFSLESYQQSDDDSYKWKMLADFTTDEDGLFTLSKEADALYANFTFQDNMLYRLTETKAPEGYAESAEPYYFVWVENGKTAEEVKQDMGKEQALGDIDLEKIRFLTTSGSIYVPNEPTELTVKKIWQSEDGMTISPGADSVKVGLYQQAVKSNGKTVTVTSTGHLSWSQPHTKLVEVADGSALTIQITNVYKNSLDIKVNDGEKISVPAGGGQVWTYTINSITADTQVEISPTDQNEGNSFGNITFSEYTIPYNVPAGEAKEYGTVTLDKKNNWSHTWDNLPRENESGQSFYYYVKEESPVPGYEVIYSANNNDGIQAGDLTVINRANGYVLPETGGGGTSLFTTGGLALIMLAGLMYIIMRRKEHGAP